MPQPHQGRLSGQTYQVPTYTEIADGPAAFIDFADSIPAPAKQGPTITSSTSPASGTAAVGDIHIQY